VPVCKTFRRETLAKTLCIAVVEASEAVKVWAPWWLAGLSVSSFAAQIKSILKSLSVQLAQFLEMPKQMDNAGVDGSKP